MNRLCTSISYVSLVTVFALTFLSSTSIIAGLTTSEDTISSKKEENNKNNDVEKAIEICRERLSENPHQSKVQHSLALLLDSQINENEDPLNKPFILDVIDLYHSVGKPLVQVQHPAPFSIRFNSLCRAATIYNDILHDKANAIRYFLWAMEIDEVDQISLMAVFEIIMPLLLSSVIEKSIDSFPVISPFGISLDKDEMPKQHVHVALDLCNDMGMKFPSEPIVDEYKGATLRKLKKPILAYESYMNALSKSHDRYQDCISMDISSSYECISLLTNYINHCILVSASGKESNQINSNKQMQYLLNAESLIYPYLHSEEKTKNMDESIWELLQNISVDLYNNMGIIEKKRKSFLKAKEYFIKALEIKPNDGHSLVQLASIKEYASTDIVCHVKELDSEYVASLFDGYSTRFESELVDVLEYKGHILVYNAIQRMWKKRRKQLSDIHNIIDLGCGTGLLGELIANEIPSANLYGTDLSQRMIEIAREKRSKTGKLVYSNLVNQDATVYLSSFASDSIDCVLASDVFIYIGDVSKLLQNCDYCLKKDGIISFTVEAHNPSNVEKGNINSGLQLLPSGRFGHSKDYIDHVAKLAGFQISNWENCVLRKQGGMDVKGAVVVLSRI